MLIKKEKNVILYLKIECILFAKTRIPFTQACFLQSLVEIGPVVLEKRTNFCKVYNDNAAASPDDGQPI